jgi:hypothetical protein
MFQKFTNQFTLFLKNKTPFIFTKLGDGEYNAAIGNNGYNCDGEKYSSKLQKDLTESVIYLSNQSNSFFGAWHTQNVIDFWRTLCDKDLNYVNYHTLIMDSENILQDCIINFFKTLKEDKRQKIYVCNYLLIKASIMLNINEFVHIPFHGWFENYFLIIKNLVISKINTENPIILISAGMGGKVLIGHLHQLYPQATFIDIGSCLDFILTKKDSRGLSFSYEDILKYFKDILPDDWNNEKYNYVYEEAKKELGIHLR